MKPLEYNVLNSMEIERDNVYVVSHDIRLGLCCLNTTLRAQKPAIFSSRRMIVRTIKEHGIELLKQKIRMNLEDVLKMIEWNQQNDIHVFRLSSELFPHYSNEQIENYSMEFAQDLLTKIGDLSRKYHHRITFHPSHFNVLGTPNDKTLQKTICDLGYHAEMLDRMSLGKDSVMVVHGGGLYDDKQLTMTRWCERYNDLPKAIKKRLVLENCEKCFNIEDCLTISQKVGIPVVFDTHHFECYKKIHPEEQFESPSYYIPMILRSWNRRGIRPKFHVSEQGSGKIGHHSDYIETIPDYLMEIPEKYDVEIDIMIEAKKKELAIKKLYAKYERLKFEYL